MLPLNDVDVADDGIGNVCANAVKDAWQLSLNQDVDHIDVAVVVAAAAVDVDVAFVDRWRNDLAPQQPQLQWLLLCLVMWR